MWRSRDVAQSRFPDTKAVLADISRLLVDKSGCVDYYKALRNYRTSPATYCLIHVIGCTNVLTRLFLLKWDSELFYYSIRLKRVSLAFI